MTTTSRTETPTRSLYSSSIFGPVVAATLLIALVAAAAPLPEQVSLFLVVTVVALLGIPHGAVDHLVADAIDGGHDDVARRRFLGRYLLAVAGVGLVWLASPPIALIGFLAVSIHHFGHSDLAHLPVPGRRRLPLYWSRGLLLIGLPLVAHLPTVAPLIDRLSGTDPTTWPWLAEWWWAWSSLLVIQHLVIGALVGSRLGPSVVGQQAVLVGVLTGLFLVSDPLVGFAVYFGLWHSLGHLLALGRVLDAGGPGRPSLVRLALPLSAISLGGLGLGAVSLGLIGRFDLLVPALFIVVSMLTAPHMVIVERLWRSDGRSVTVAGSS